MIAPVEAPPVLTTGDVLKAAFPQASVTQRRSQEMCVHTIPQNGEPRWIALGDVKRALPVLRSWSPWNLTSRIKWNAVLAAASSGILAHLPGVMKSRAPIELDFWRRSELRDLIGAADAHRSGIAIHVGNRSHTRKAILFFIDDQKIRFAAKVPLVPGADHAILNEAAVLQALEGSECLPRTLFVDARRGIAAQSWLDGKPVARGLGAPHLDLLGKLARPGRTVRVIDFQPAVAVDVERLPALFDRKVLRQALRLLSYAEPLPCFVEHRDFAPWNLKWLPNGKLGLLDWEWSVLNGLPWQDVCRFFYVDDAHFNGPGNVWEKMGANRLLQKHREHFEIPLRALPPLTMHYLLRVLAMDWWSGNSSLAQHSYRQVQRLLALAGSDV